MFSCTHFAHCLNFCLQKSVRTRFAALHNSSIDTCLVIKAISFDNFIAIDQMKRFTARLFFEFYLQKFRLRKAKCLSGNLV